MQLFALSDNGPIFCQDATKDTSYNCPECGGILKLKAGSLRQKHFYHLRKSPYCKQSNKSHTHLEVQKHLLHILPASEAEMEKQFPSINRIADVVWTTKNIVFEIQCSPISENEARSRCKDYESLGLKVVWLLSDKLFNKKRIKESESYLRKKLAYYFYLNPKNEISIYDQLEIASGPFRFAQGSKMSVLINQPMALPRDFEQTTAGAIRQERQIYFMGDVVSKALQNPSLISNCAKIPSHPIRRKNYLLIIWETLLRIFLD